MQCCPIRLRVRGDDAVMTSIGAIIVVFRYKTRTCESDRSNTIPFGTKYSINTIGNARLGACRYHKGAFVPTNETNLLARNHDEYYVKMCKKYLLAPFAPVYAIKTGHL